MSGLSKNDISDFTNLALSTVAQATGTKLPKTTAEISKALGGGSEDAKLFAALSSKIPKLEPETFRRFNQDSQRFFEYLKNTRPDILPHSAQPAILCEQLKLWLYDRVAQSEITVKNGKTRNNEKGEQVPMRISEITLHGYRVVAQRLCLYSFPAPSPTQLKTMRDELALHTFHLVSQFGLSRNNLPKETMGPPEVRLVLEDLLEDEKETGHFALQAALLVVLFMLTGMRRSSILSTSDYPNAYMRWQDIELTPSRNSTGVIEGIHATIVFGTFKGHRVTNKYTLRFRVTTMKKRANIVFDLGLFLFAQAFRNGIFVNSHQDWRSFFEPTTQDEYWAFDPEKLSKPLVFRGIPKGQGLDTTQPLAADSFGRYFKDVCIRTGLRGPTDSTVTLYALRRDCLTRLYNASEIGPVVAKQVAAHAEGSNTLEKYYLSNRDNVSLTTAAGMGEIAEPDMRLYETRVVPREQKLNDIELRQRDEQYDVLSRSTELLSRSVTQGAVGWKSAPPFSLTPDKYRNFDLEDTVRLLVAFRRLTRLRKDKLRRMEESGQFDDDEPVQPNWQIRSERRKESAQESKLTRNVQHKCLDEASQISKELTLNDVSTDLEISEDAIEEDVQTDKTSQLVGSQPGTMAHQVAEDSAGGVWTAKLKFLERLITVPQDTAQPCPLCVSDPTCSEAEQQRMWQPYQLFSVHLGGVEPGAPYPLKSTLVHAPRSRLWRFLAKKGWCEHKKEKGKGYVACMIPDDDGKKCGTTTSKDLYPRHLTLQHLDIIPKPYQIIAADLSNAHQDARDVAIDRYTKNNAKTDTDKTNITITPLINLPMSYHRDTLDNAKEMSRQTLLHLSAILRPAHRSSFALDPDAPLIPPLDGIEDEHEIFLLNRLNDLFIDVPEALYDDSAKKNLIIDNTIANGILDDLDPDIDLSVLFEESLKSFSRSVRR